MGDSMAGAVLKVDQSGTVTVWAEHALLAGDKATCNSQAPDFAVGANGIAFDDDGNLLILNTHGATVVRIPVESDGSAGRPSVFVGPDCTLLEGADGLAIDRKGNIYVVDFLNHKLVRVDPDGEITLLDSGGLLDSPASLAFGVGEHRETLYITNFAFLSASGGGDPRPGILSKVIGIKGRLLP